MPSSATALYLLGTAALKLGEIQRAEVYLSQSLILDPDFKGTMVNLGVVFLRQQRFDEARAVSENLRKRFPYVSQSYYHIGLACYHQAVQVQKRQEMYKGLKAESPFSQKMAASYQHLREKAFANLTKAVNDDFMSDGQRMLRALERDRNYLPPVEVTESTGWIMCNLRI